MENLTCQDDCPLAGRCERHAAEAASRAQRDRDYFADEYEVLETSQASYAEVPEDEPDPGLLAAEAAIEKAIAETRRYEREYLLLHHNYREQFLYQRRYLMEDCPGPRLKRRLRRLGRKTIVCASPQRRYVGLNIKHAEHLYINGERWSLD